MIERFTERLQDAMSKGKFGINPAIIELIILALQLLADRCPNKSEVVERTRKPSFRDRLALTALLRQSATDLGIERPFGFIAEVRELTIDTGQSLDDDELQSLFSELRRVA